MPVKLGRGVLYATVQERLIAAHGDDSQPIGIKSIVTEPLGIASPVGMCLVVRATVTFSDGRVFTGVSEAQFDAVSGADKTNPVECAETSAVGRALANAGFYGNDTGLAGAEEVQAAQKRDNQPPRSAPRTAGPTQGTWGQRATAPPFDRELREGMADLAKGAKLPMTAAALRDDVSAISAGIVEDTARMKAKGKSPNPGGAAAYYLFLASVADSWNDANPEEPQIEYEHPPYGAAADWFVTYGVPLKTALLALGYTKEQLIAPAS